MKTKPVIPRALAYLSEATEQTALVFLTLWSEPEKKNP